MRHFKRIALSLVLLCSAMQAANAHALLLSATPAVGSTQSSAPPEIALQFSEAIEPRFSTVTVTNEAGTVILTSKPALRANDPSVLVVKLATRLEAGSYKVRWRAVSVDTHQTEGGFSFAVK